MSSSKISVVGLILAVTIVAAAAFTPPNGKPYGYQSDGTSWLAANLVSATEGSVPKLKSLPDNWAPRAMVLDGQYYVCHGKPRLAGSWVDFCFDIGGGHYIPHALQQIDDQSILANVNQDEIVSNGVNGYNFHCKVVK